MVQPATKTLVFEWLSGGGSWFDGSATSPGTTMALQGLEMLRAITADLMAGRVEVVVPLDCRLLNSNPLPVGCQVVSIESAKDLAHQLMTQGARADHVMLIAPESEGRLVTCIDWIDEPQKLISPDKSFSELTACKSGLFRHLHAAGFHSYPPGVNLSDYAPVHSMQFRPAVLKPDDGAGSDEVQLIEDMANWSGQLPRAANCYRLEEFVSGTPMSVSVLCGPAGHWLLPPTLQIFDREPFGNYVAAGYPVDPKLANRAGELARRALAALPKTRGYIGLDMVISDLSQRHDCLIEINPRLTMSYIRLREICGENLAIKMLHQAVSTP